MAHLNEKLFLHYYLTANPVLEWPEALWTSRILEVGSKVVDTESPKHRQNYRMLFPSMNVVGLDQEPGDGVDLVGDITTGDVLGDEQFGGIICCSVLEHCQNPWKAADVLVKHLKPGGLLYISVPWIWRYHPYPDDYWRMSVSGVQLLFPSIRWERIAYATQQTGEFLSHKTPLKGHPWRQLQGQRVVLVTQFVCMIGRRV